MLPLPKEVVADPRHEALRSLLEARAVPLWERGHQPVATLPPSAALFSALRGALPAGLAVQGLELIAEKLAAEQKGLDAAQAKAPASPPSPRVSRVLLLADDGSPRFYRDADALLGRYAQRLLGVRLALAGEAFGEALTGAPRLMRAVLILDKKIAARALLSLLPPG